MTFGKRLCLTLGAVALGALVSASAIAQVTGRLATAGGAATSTKIIPGGTASIDMRIDVTAIGVGCTVACLPGATGLTGAAFRLTQSAPVANGFFSITGRSFVGSPFNDVASGTSDAIVLVPPSNLLDPDNNDNLGRTTVGLVPVVPPTANTLAANLTLTASGATPLGTYTIIPTPVVSTASDDAFNDYDISTGASYSIIVGQTLTINKTGTGAALGNVTADSGLINCGAVCSDIYPGTVVTLTATPNPGDTFTGWSGGSPACSGTGTCVVTVDVAQTVTANFLGALPPQTLTVTLAGAGSGTVTSAPAGISCNPTCSAPFAAGTVVTLTATPNGTSTFTGWSGGGCSGTGTCVVTMNSATAVTATFGALPSFNLSVTLAGNGLGTVTSAPAGISCPGTCSSLFLSGTVVTLTATPNASPPTQVFAGWSGAGCSGTGTCVVTMSSAQAVTATFTDAVPPTTAITGTPTNPSSVPNPQFTFNSPSDPTATFQCSLDGAPFTACVSPHTVNVGNGNHTFSVRAVDQGGNVDPAPPSFAWLVQGIVAPTVVGIPTLSEWMLVLLALILGSAGILARRRKG